MNRSALVLLPLALVAGCGSASTAHAFPQPPVGSFHDGPCRTTAPAMLRIGRDARHLGKGRTPPQDLLEHLKADQALLVAAQPDFDPQSKPAIDALVIEVGLVRLRSDTTTYTPSLAPPLSEAYAAAVAACTAPTASATP